jgi:hypothetical protein
VPRSNAPVDVIHSKIADRKCRMRTAFENNNFQRTMLVNQEDRAALWWRVTGTDNGTFGTSRQLDFFSPCFLQRIRTYRGATETLSENGGRMTVFANAF